MTFEIDSEILSRDSKSKDKVWSKSENITLGRRLISLVAKEYRYKGRDIARYIRKDPLVMRDLKVKEKGKLEKEMGKVIDLMIGKRLHVNNQV